MKVTGLGNAAYLVVDETNHQEVVYVASAGAVQWAFSNGCVYELRPPAATSTVSAGNRGSVGPITAPMPGTIRKVLVEPGQRVTSGDTLLVLEAMKMELPLRAIDDGTVAAVRCREGELVQADAILIEFVGEIDQRPA